MKPQPAGIFIVLEGIDGAGKSTQIAAIERLVRAHGREVLTTREPGGSPLAERIRELLLAIDGAAPCAEAELLLLFAARVQHLHECIRPALNAGKVVVCERFTCSTYAYQGHGRGLDGELIATLERRLLNDCRVDLTILLDLPVEAALRRLHATGKSNDRFHHEPRAFLDAVHAGYRSLNRQHQGDPHWQVIAADAPMDTVATHIATALQPYLAPA